MSHGCIDILVGETYSNDLAPRYVEHRRVTGLAGGFVQYEITHGKREGATGAATPHAFWHWQRAVVLAHDAEESQRARSVFPDPLCNNGAAEIRVSRRN